ncbi:MAG: DUF4145 domain-containing protein [Nitrosopumilus sp.]|nr:DUF4145 domain-containing protein [Nitrosopumilus sp.]
MGTNVIEYGSTTGNFNSMNGIVKECTKCRKYTIWLKINKRYKLIHPNDLFLPPAHPDMPGPVHELYEEARNVASVSERHGIAALRMCLEGIAKEEGYKDGTLEKRIDALCEKNKLVGDELIPFDLIRKAGNDIIHLKEKYTRNDLMLLSDGILYICQMIYERRRKIAAMKKIKK